MTLCSLLRVGKPFIDLAQCLLYTIFGFQTHSIYHCFPCTSKYQCTDNCEIRKGVNWLVSPLSVSSGDSLVNIRVSSSYALNKEAGQPQSFEWLHFIFLFSPFSHHQVLPVMLSPRKHDPGYSFPSSTGFVGYIHLLSIYDGAALVVPTLVTNSAKLAPPSSCIWFYTCFPLVVAQLRVGHLHVHYSPFINCSILQFLVLLSC